MHVSLKKGRICPECLDGNVSIAKRDRAPRLQVRTAGYSLKELWSYRGA